MNYIVLDTETVNGFDDPLCYDVGWAVVDENFEVIAVRSYVVADIFLDETELMRDAFFADKIPQYWADIKSGKRELKTYFNIGRAFREDCRNYAVGRVFAHNARFDYRSTTATQRWLTKSKYRYFIPYGIEIWDSLKLAQNTFGKDEDYKAFCRDNGFVVGSRPRLTAEILYRYIINDINFEESHTGLEDVLIEKEIAKACFAMNPNVDGKLWE